MLDPKLETLLTVYEQKNYTKAATRLQLTQPAVSAQMNQLEMLLGCTLCVHSKGQLIFTPEGELVINYAKRLKTVHTKMIEEIDKKQGTPSKLKIGVTKAVEGDSIIANTLGQYISNNAGANITIFSDTIKKLYAMLENFELDIIIIDAPHTNPLFSCHLLDTTEILCLIGNNNPLSRKKYVSLEEIKQERMILRPPSSATRTLFEAALKKANVSIDHLNIVLETDSYTTIKHLVSNNVGISIMPQRSCQHDLNRGAFSGLHIEELDMMRNIYLVYRKDCDYPNVLNDLAHIYQNARYD